MAYTAIPGADRQIRVYKVDAHGQPFGQALGFYANPEAAQQQIASLELNDIQQANIKAQMVRLIAPEMPVAEQRNSPTTNPTPNGTQGQGPASQPQASAPPAKKTRAAKAPKKTKGPKASKAPKAPKTRKPRKPRQQKQPGQRKSTGRPRGHPAGVPNAKELNEVAASAEPIQGEQKWFEGDTDQPPSWQDYGKIDQDDPRADYDPMGMTDGEACANCQWFQPEFARCRIVEGVIVATGKSKLWLAQSEDEDEDDDEPMPVYIVGQDQKDFKTSSNSEISVDLDTENEAEDTESSDLERVIGDKAAISKRDDTNPKEGKDKYGDVKFADPTNKKYPIDTEEHTRSAWSYINKQANADKYSAAEVKAIKGRIKTAAKKFGIEISDDSSSGKKSWLDGIKDLLGLGAAQQQEPELNPQMGFRALPNMKWAAWWTNNFEDGHKEIFSEAAHDRFIERVETGVLPYPELWYRHMPVPSGKAEWLGRVGHLVLAAGSFYDTGLGRTMYQHYRKEKEARTVSHGYFFLPSQKDKEGTYHDYFTYEISPLYAGEEANPVTGFGVKEMMRAVTDDKIKDLGKIIGAEEAVKLMQFGEQRSKEIEEKFGLRFKELTAEQTPADAPEVGTKELVGAIKELALMLKSEHERSEKLSTSLTEQGKAISELQDYIKEMFGSVPRASSSPQTQLVRQQPLLEFMAKKQLEQQPDGQEVTNPLAIIMKQIEKGA